MSPFVPVLALFALAVGLVGADSPADADVLLEAGELSGGLRDAPDLVERQLGEPYVRVALRDPSQVAARTMHRHCRPPPVRRDGLRETG